MASSILDQFGRPMQLNGDASRLKNTGFALQNVSTFSGIVGTVAKTYRWAFDEALRTSPADALAMRRDGAIMALLRERQMPTANSKWHLEPEDQDDPQQEWVAEQLTYMVQAIPRFSRFRLQLLEAIWYGRYANQFSIGKKVVRGQTRYCILNHQPVHGDKLIFRWDGTPGVLISQLYSHKYQERGLVGVTQPYVERLKAQGAVILPSDRGLALFLETPQWRERFAVHMHEAEDADFMEPQLAGGIHGVGLRTRIFWLWWLRNEVLSSLLDYLQRVGAGGLTLIGFEQGNNSSLEAAKEIGGQLQAGNVILVPKPVGQEKLTSTVDRVEPSQAGSQVLMQIVNEFFDDWIERAIVGQTMSGGSDGEGSLGGTGRANLAADTKSQLIQMDAEALDECITEQVVQPMKRWNFPTCDFKVYFKTGLAKPDPQKSLDAAQKAWEMGCELREEEVMEVAGFSMPEEGDKTVSKAQTDEQEAESQGAAMGDDGGQAQQALTGAAEDGSLFTPEGVQGLQASLDGAGAADEALASANGEGDPKRYQRDGEGFPDRPLKYEARHAPKGGVLVQGTFYRGGQFIPAEVVAQATEEELEAIEDGEPEDEAEFDVEEEGAFAIGSTGAANEDLAKIAAAHNATAILRWMGKKGWNKGDAMKVMAALGFDVNPSTVGIQLSAGRTGARGEPAGLTEKDELAMELARRGDAPPPKPPPPKPPELPPPPVAEKPKPTVPQVPAGLFKDIPLGSRFWSLPDDVRGKIETMVAHQERIGEIEGWITRKRAAANAIWESMKHIPWGERPLQMTEAHEAASREVIDAINARTVHKEKARELLVKTFKVEKSAPKPRLLGGTRGGQQKKVSAAIDFFMPMISEKTKLKKFINVEAAKGKGRNGDAHAKDGGGGLATIALKKSSSPQTAAHEFGHTVEYANQNVLRATVEFHARRTARSSNILMRQVSGLRGYGDEMGNPDNFEAIFDEPHRDPKNKKIRAAYTGKVYRSSGNAGETVNGIRATEIVSMGMEALYDNPGQFAKADPEYFGLIVGILGGHIG